MESSRRVAVNLPAALEPVIERRRKELKYRSLSAYFISLAVFDLYARKPHLLTGSLHNDLPEIRDQFYDEIARDFDNMAEKPAGWFEMRLKELVATELAKAAKAPGTPPPPPA